MEGAGLEVVEDVDGDVDLFFSSSPPPPALGDLGGSAW